MQSATLKSSTLFAKNSAILMARLVDHHGVPIRRGDVCAINCSIYELDPCWPNLLSLVAGYEAISLDVADAIFDSLQTSELWTVDAVGFNFRHEIAGHSERFPKRGFRYELLYAITGTGGKKTNVRFSLGASRRNRS